MYHSLSQTLPVPTPCSVPPTGASLCALAVAHLQIDCSMAYNLLHQSSAALENINAACVQPVLPPPLGRCVGVSRSSTAP